MKHRGRATEEKVKAVGKFAGGHTDQALKTGVFDDCAEDDPYLIQQVEHLSTIRDIGEAAAREILVMLSAWLCDSDNITEQYWRRLGEKSN